MKAKLRTSHGGFTLVEIMIVVAIIALLATISVPGVLRARLRGQASTLVNELRLVDAAKDQYIVEHSKTTGSWIEGSDLRPYFKKDSALFNALEEGWTGVSRLGGAAYIEFLDPSSLPYIVVPQAILDVAPADTFWAPYLVYGY